jgi:hypothetical protein
MQTLPLAVIFADNKGSVFIAGQPDCFEKIKRQGQWMTLPYIVQVLESTADSSPFTNPVIPDLQQHPHS